MSAHEEVGFDEMAQFLRACGYKIVDSCCVCGCDMADRIVALESEAGNAQRWGAWAAGRIRELESALEEALTRGGKGALWGMDITRLRAVLRKGASHEPP